ncbi:MAG: hypothetical protein KGL39_24270 [Patescibacteria group bacterium]|nr:hypothetical protein [Patescibacteria group bacterium]
MPFLADSTKRQPDGSINVYGKVTSEEKDLDNQIADSAWSTKALNDWFAKFANVRQMHRPDVAGKALELDHKADGSYIAANVYEPGAIKHVEKGGYTGFSIGIKSPIIKRDPKAEGGRIVGGTIVEVSLVDYPCNESAKFVIAKSADADGDIELVESAEPKLTLDKVAEDVAERVSKESETLEGKASGEPVADEVDYAAIAARVLLKGTLSDADRDKMDNSDFAYVDSKGDKHLPIHDESHVRAALGRFNQTQFEDGDAKRKAAKKILSAAKKHGIQVADDSAVSEAAKSEKSAVIAAGHYAIKRLHDLICPAHDMTEVLFTYPELAKGLSVALDPKSVVGAVWQMLSAEVAEDGGSGSESDDIKDIACAYAHLCEFLDDEDNEGETQTQIMGAPLALLAAQAELHKRFAAANPGVEFHPTAPSQAEFNAEALAHIEPVARPVERKPNRVFYSHDKRDEVTNALRRAHDAFAALVGCEVHADYVTTTDEPTERASEDEPASEKAATLTQLEKQAEAAIEAAKDLLTKQLGQRDQEIVDLKAQLEKMAAEPDPHRAPIRRGIMSVDDKAVKVAEIDDEQVAIKAELATLRKFAADHVNSPELTIWSNEQIRALEGKTKKESV